MSKQPTGHLRGNDLILTRSFKAPIQDVWESVTKSERTARWYGIWEGDARPGGSIRIKMNESDKWSDATIHVCEAPRHLAYTTTGPHGSHLELRLREANGVTELEFTHHLVDPSSAGDYGPGWEYYLDCLVASRDDAALPAFEDYYPSQKAYYLAQLK